MAWHLSVYQALLIAALLTSVLGLLGWTATCCCRQPIRRIRIIEVTLIACLVAPVLTWLPGIPAWRPAWLAASTNAGVSISDLHDSASVLPHHATRVSSAPVREPALAADGITAKDRSRAVDRSIAAVTNPIESSTFIGDYRYWVVIAYAGGVGLLGLWGLAGALALARLCHQARPAPGEARELLRKIGGADARRVWLLTSDRVSQPFTFTFVRPVIVLPANLASGLNEPALRMSLAHEWSHVAHRHAHAWLLAGLVRMFYFYHPVCWWLRSQLRLCQDYIADADTVRSSTAEDYASFLVRQVARLVQPLSLPGLGIGSHKSELYRRVIMLVENKRPVETRSPRGWSLLVAVTAIAITTSMAAVAQTPGSDPSSEASNKGNKGSTQLSDGTVSDVPESVSDEARPADRAARRKMVHSKRPRDGKTSSDRSKLRYAGKKFDAWHDVLLNDLSPDARIEAAQALGEFAAHGYAKEVASIMRDLLDGGIDGKVASAAAKALTKAGKSGVKVLMDGLKHQSVSIRGICIDRLGEMKQAASRALPAIIELTGDGDGDLRYRAVQSLIRIGSDEKTIVPVLSRILREDEAAASFLIRLLPESPLPDQAVVQLLLKGLRNPSTQVQRAAVSVAPLRGEAHEADLVPTIVEAMRTSDASSGQSFASQIFIDWQVAGTISPTIPGAVVVACLRDEMLKRDLGIRQMGPQILGRCGKALPEGAIEVLIDMIRERGLGYEPALQALGEIGPPAKQAVDELRKLDEAMSQGPNGTKNNPARTALRKIERPDE